MERRLLHVFAFTILLLNCAYFIACNSKSNSNLISTQISSIVQQYFSPCELIFITIQPYNLSTTRDFQLPFQQKGTAGNYVANRESDNVVTFNRLKDVHKFHVVQCGLGILYIGRTSPNLPVWLFETVTPRYVPIIRKDEDNFIFVFKSEDEAEEILSSYSFGQKIKLKLGIVVQKHDKPLLYKTVNLYGNYGQPVVHPIHFNYAFTDAHKLFPDTTYNFHRKVLRVVKVKPDAAFEMAPLPNGEGNKPVRGFYKMWLDIMMSQFNFTITLKLASLGGGTGKLFPNGTWRGAVADILYDDADLGVYVGHIYNRHPFVDWSAPLSYEWMVFIAHKPRTFYSPSAIIRAFPLLLWLGFLLSIVIICFVLKLILKYYPTNSFSYKASLQFLLSSFLEQDSLQYAMLSVSPVRMLVSFWLLFALVLSTAYKGKLVSLIAFPATNWVPVTMDDLAFSPFRVGVNVLGKGGASYTIFSTSKHPVYKRIFEKMEIYYDAAECLKEGLSHDIGCIMWISVAEYNVYRNFTDKFGRTPFQASPHATSFLVDGYIWEKRAIFAQNFNKITWAILERGLASYMTETDFNEVKRKSLEWHQRNHNNHSLSSEGSLDAEVSKLELVHLTGLYYLLFLGQFISCCAFLWELAKRKGLFRKFDCVLGTKRQDSSQDLLHMKVFEAK